MSRVYFLTMAGSDVHMGDGRDVDGSWGSLDSSWRMAGKSGVG